MRASLLSVTTTTTAMFTIFLLVTAAGAGVETNDSRRTSGSNGSSTSTSTSSSDYDKLMTALTEITSKFHNIDTILQTFGVSTLPLAQRYGIFFGCITFISTIAIVVLLLFFGGTFTRIAKESQQTNRSSSDNNNNDDTPSDIRQQRSLLYEELLQQRQRMILRYNNYSNIASSSSSSNSNNGGGMTLLTQMLCNVAPTTSKPTNTTATAATTTTATPPVLTLQQQQQEPQIIAYQENYRIAYRQCQDRPGGSIISGYPEARYEAYAYGYASCGHGGTIIDIVNDNNGSGNDGDDTTTKTNDNNTNNTTVLSYPIILDTSYRRSYGRMIESITCQDHTTIEYYHNHIFIHRPNDIIGAYIRLEPLVLNNNNNNDLQQTSASISKNHCYEIYHFTCTGEPTMECMKSYNPYDIWCFHNDGPYTCIEHVHQSKYLFPSKQNTAAFVIRQNITNHFIGIIQLLNDEPEHLSIQLQIPLLAPKYTTPSTCKECMEGYFVLIDRLFAYGYRRIYIMIDTQDIQSIQFVYKLGFTHEGCFYKHHIIKDANRNSHIYAILNSDWKQSNLQSSPTTTMNSTTSTGTGTKTQPMSFRTGARAVLYQKLYGISKFRNDQSNEKYEAEKEFQTIGLREQQKQEEKEQADNNKGVSGVTSDTDKKKN